MALDVKDLKIYYRTLRGTAKAADGITFSVADGEILGVAGESGCGKSTVCNSLILLKPPMSLAGGTVKLDGEALPIGDFEAMRRFRLSDVSIIPQYAMDALNPTRRFGSILRDLLECRGLKYEDYLEKIKARLDLLNLSESVLTMYPFELSGGMKQRAVMVLATLLDPSLLICDEITSALDVTSQRAVVEMTARFVDQRITRSMLFVTHDMSVLYQIAHSVMVMYAGKLAERAPSEILFKNPLHPYTQMLVSSLPELGVRSTVKRLKGIPGRPPSLLSPPAGCRFRDRCPESGPDCMVEPPVSEVSKGHFIACWRRGGKP